MAYKIVEYIVNNCTVLIVVPDSWEKDGTVALPPIISQAIRENTMSDRPLDVNSQWIYDAVTKQWRKLIDAEIESEAIKNNPNRVSIKLVQRKIKTKHNGPSAVPNQTSSSSARLVANTVNQSFIKQEEGIRNPHECQCRNMEPILQNLLKGQVEIRTNLIKFIETFSKWTTNFDVTLATTLAGITSIMASKNTFAVELQQISQALNNGMTELAQVIDSNRNQNGQTFDVNLSKSANLGQENSIDKAAPTNRRINKN